MSETYITNPESPESIPKHGRFSKKTILLTSGIVFLALIFVFTILLFSTKTSIKNEDEINTVQENSQSPKTSAQKQKENQAIIEKFKTSNTIVYGSWKGEQSVITSIDLLSNKSAQIATLPFNIKKVSVLSPENLIFINQTDNRDYGTQITSFQIKEKSSKTLVTASPGFGIDDYILSPNKEYMVIWEVRFAPRSEVLQGGRSRVFAVKLSTPGNKQLLYDELATEPIHYPRAILNDGKVFTDKFLPNDPNGGAGWAYGMGVSDFTGSNKRELDQMKEGSYGTQPSLSHDGKFLVFAGYDGKNGDGKAAPEGFRQALLTPNTIELLDTSTLARRKLTNLSNNDIYPTAEWGGASNNIMITVISKIENKNGLFRYDLTSQKPNRLKIPGSNSLVSSFTTDKYLIATIDDSASSLGNLGEVYAPSLTQLFNFDPKTNQAFRIPVSDTHFQYVTTLPSNYFQKVLGMKAYAQGGNPSDPNVTIIDLYSDKPSQENLQLKTFLFKPSLTIKRQEQQTKPIPTPIPTGPVPTRQTYKLTKTVNCTSLALEQCGIMGYNRNQCIMDRRVQLRAEGKCNQSPLYLYGNEGQNVRVQILTAVYNDKPSYNSGYDVTLGNNGKMLINGNSYQAINYDYLSNLRKLNPPTRGSITKKTEIEKVLREYAKKLGLNEKEIKDLVRVGKTKTNSPYVFISFFDQATSEQILPLTFLPEPDNYLNVVFYFRQLDQEPNYTPAPPVFDKPLLRTGLTAVEVSEIVE
ncbi:MAG TPA: hypothetical protein VM077_04680 [Candidatus Limnocylindrales bacterium]|nr:hypothetical protein [Candidatus Limnocylindrales bacterium]